MKKEDLKNLLIDEKEGKYGILVIVADGKATISSLAAVSTIDAKLLPKGAKQGDRVYFDDEGNVIAKKEAAKKPTRQTTTRGTGSIKSVTVKHEFDHLKV